MKKSILVLLASILLSCPMNLMGSEFNTTHEFTSGDTLSAEMINELFENIRLSKTFLTNASILGKWNCENTVGYSTNSTWISNKDSMGYVSDDDNLIEKLSNQIVTFKSDGDNTYSYSEQSIPSVIYPSNNSTLNSGNYTISNNIIYLEYAKYSSIDGIDYGYKTQKMFIDKLSKNGIVIKKSRWSSCRFNCLFKNR